jgi:hypothetical protein
MFFGKVTGGGIRFLGKHMFWVIMNGEFPRDAPAEIMVDLGVKLKIHLFSTESYCLGMQLSSMTLLTV